MGELGKILGVHSQSEAQTSSQFVRIHQGLSWSDQNVNIFVAAGKSIPVPFFPAEMQSRFAFQGYFPGN